MLDTENTTPQSPPASSPSSTPPIDASVEGVESGRPVVVDEVTEQEERQVITKLASRPREVTLSLRDKAEAFIARLSTRNKFWHRVCSLIWLPYAFKSGIQMKRVDESSFSATLPFKRFNRNWYNAMAGAALLANSEIAAGAYIMGITGGDYTIVCKHLEYKFLRPCYGPAIYKITPREDLLAKIATGKEFNMSIDLEVLQQALLPAALTKLKKKDPVLARICAKDRKVGTCTATFHVTPTIHQKAKRGDTRKVG